MPEWIYIYRRHSVGNLGVVGRPVFTFSVLSHSIFDVTSVCHAAPFHRIVPLVGIVVGRPLSVTVGLSHNVFDVTSSCHAAPRRVIHMANISTTLLAIIDHTSSVVGSVGYAHSSTRIGRVVNVGSTDFRRTS